MKIFSSTVYTFGQLIELITQLNDEKYAAAIQITGSSSIGKHVRHIIELYQCLINGLPSGTIDYDNRLRNCILENDRKKAVDALNNILLDIADLNIDKELLVCENQSNENHKEWVKSSLQRELMYNLEHCIHHMALIALCVKINYKEIDVPENFGKAFSTIKFEQSQICAQ
jgi:uncharacterized damage-inducible protein DinB